MWLISHREAFLTTIKSLRLTMNAMEKKIKASNPSALQNASQKNVTEEREK